MKTIIELTELYNSHRKEFSPEFQKTVRNLLQYCKTSNADVADLHDLEELLKPSDPISDLASFNEWRPAKNIMFKKAIIKDSLTRKYGHLSQNKE